MPKRKTHQEFVDELKVTHPNLTVLSEYKGDKQYVEVICNIHNYKFRTKPNWLHHGKNCQKCYDERRVKTLRKTNDKLKNELLQKYENKYFYPKLDEEYKNNKSKITIVCPIHGEFKQTVNHHLRGQECPKCACERNGFNKRLTTEDFIAKSIQKHGLRYDYSNVNYTTTSDKVTIICPVHGKFEQAPEAHLQGHGCPKCQQSHLEYKIERLLTENNIEFIPQYRNKSLIGRKSIDFYLPNKKVAIECQGSQHFTPSIGFGGEEEFNNLVIRDISKYNEMIDKNKIIYITNKKNKQYLKNKKFYGIYNKNVLFIEDIEKDLTILISHLTN